MIRLCNGIVEVDLNHNGIPDHLEQERLSWNDDEPEEPSNAEIIDHETGEVLYPVPFADKARDHAA